MARRKNKKFIDPRYFMDEKMERLDEAHDTGQGDAPTDEEIKERKTKCTGSGGKWHAGYAISLGHHGHCKCSDGSTSRVGACKKKEEVNEDLYEAEEEDPRSRETAHLKCRHETCSELHGDKYEDCYMDCMGNLGY